VYILFLVHPIFGASYLWGSLPSYVVPYISVSYFCTSYFWFFLSLRFPFLTLWFLISVDPMFGVSYFCVPIFVSSYLYVTLKMGKRPISLTWSRVSSKYQESCILTQCSAKIVIRYILHQGMYHTSTLREGWSQRPLRNRVIISDKKWKKWKKVKKWEKSEKKVLGSVSSSLLHTQVRFSMSNYILHPGNASISIIYQQGGIFYCCNCRNDLLLTCYD